jgi:hypothetical protein
MKNCDPAVSERASRCRRLADDSGEPAMIVEGECRSLAPDRGVRPASGQGRRNLGRESEGSGQTQVEQAVACPVKRNDFAEPPRGGAKKEGGAERP